MKRKTVQVWLCLVAAFLFLGQFLTPMIPREATKVTSQTGLSPSSLTPRPQNTVIQHVSGNDPQKAQTTASNLKKPAAQSLSTAADKFVQVKPQSSQPSRMAQTIASWVNFKYAPGTSPEQIAQEAGAKLIKKGPLNFATLQLASSNIAQGLAKVKSLPGVLSAQKSQLVQAAAISSYSGSNSSPQPKISKASSSAQTSSSTQTNSSTQINSTTQASSSSAASDPLEDQQWSLQKADVPQAWALGATGQGITIAVIDTGVDLTNPDLQDNLVPGYNAIIDSTDPSDYQDDNGHGTHVAGIAAAELNGIGVVGVAYNAKIMPVKAMDSNGDGDDADIADGIVWAADHGANIINLSLGSDSESDILTQAIAYANAKGCLIVAAAGNYESGADPGISYPAADPNVLAVTATDENDKVADFSCQGPQAALAAPGVDIPSDFWDPVLGSTYAVESGTSMASPFVSGTAALVWSRHPHWTAGQVKVALENGATDLGTKGRDDAYGYGLVDAYRAVAFAEAPATLTSPATVTPVGGTVVDSLNSSLKLAIPPQAFTTKQTVTLASASGVPDFPANVISGGSAFSVTWNAGVQPQKMLELSAEGTPPSSDKAMAGYLFTLSGKRWIRVGGGSEGPTVSAGIYTPGIYRVGYLPVSQAQRVAGADRISTAIQIAEQAFPTGADTVIIARADDFPDALAGAPLAYKDHAPILLTYPNSLDPSVLAEIRKLAPQKIIILGGTGAVSTEIENELQSLATVQRIAGSDRYATAAAIAQALGTVGQAFIASGENFPDALSVASVAARLGEPVLLTSASGEPSSTDQALRQLSVTQTGVIGGTGVIPDDQYENLPYPDRLAGDNRYATAAAVMTQYPAEGSSLYIATGDNFPDALVGSVLAALESTDIMLVPSSGPTSAERELAQSWHSLEAIALGGSGAVSATALADLK